MIVRNQRLLNEGNYNRIHIGDNINVYGKNSNLDTILTTKFTESLKGLSDKEKKEEVIKYFLRNNMICTITKSFEKPEYADNIGWITKEYLIIKTLSGKTLKISKNDEVLTEDLLKEIYLKYELDRIDYFNNNDFEVYSLGTSYQTSITKKYYSFCYGEDLKFIAGSEFINKKGLSLDIEIKDNEISSIDRYILESIINTGELIDHHGVGGSDVYVFKDSSGNYKSVKVEYTLDRKIFNSMVRDLQQNKKEEKKKVIRMEEFK